MDVKADHRAARALIDRNFFDVQRVDGKDIAMGLAFWRRRAAVSGLAKIGTGLNRFFGQFRLSGAGSLR